MSKEKILKNKPKKFQDKINDAPILPGCYLYKDGNGKVLYVGKAKILKNRVNSYFTNFSKIELDKQEMILKAQDIEFITVDSEVEALILETNLIKKYKTKYNIMMRDGKNYIYVKFEKKRKKNQPVPNRNSIHQDFPRIHIVRDLKDDGAEYFGPYPDSMPAKRILRKLRRVFPFRTSNTNVYYDYEKEVVVTSDPKPCFYYHIGLCNGACSGKENVTDYNKRFNEIRRYFKGEKLTVVKKLERDITNAAKKLEFETAAKLRDRLNDIKYISADIKVRGNTDDVLLEQMKKQKKSKGLDELINYIDFPSEYLQNHKNFRIECYDISNIQGTNAVGSMTVMVDGEVKPKLYRRFRIKMKNEPNDFGMLQEVFRRRLKYLQAMLQNLDYEIDSYDDYLKVKDFLIAEVRNTENRDLSLATSKTSKSTSNSLFTTYPLKPTTSFDESFFWLPDLIIVDGGKGQLASTYKILYQFGLHNIIPLVGLAKREEDIFKITYQFSDEFLDLNESAKFKKIHMPRKSEALYIVQRIRDEAHRFAITYHRKLRSKQMLKEIRGKK
ncbi:MAG: UvrB/UvrC motif-containing protein [Candidatus Dojkabacteria bacterium]|nr:UvrB/UvrC motif-containing protein [Candidatus Dojkabacteria bacterium]MDQ7021453.1 UvrB/UvrC motif-containing protein [Candidatus Dojkabacteria bacterium]